jgi:hypothetical protein
MSIHDLHIRGICWAASLFPIARLMLGWVAFGLPFVCLKFGSKLSRRLGDRWSSCIALICIMGGMILLAAPLPWSIDGCLNLNLILWGSLTANFPHLRLWGW